MMDIATMASWAGVFAIPLTVAFGLVSWRGVHFAKEQVTQAAKQTDLAMVQQQIEAMRASYEAQVGMHQDMHAECLRQAERLRQQVSELQERVAIQRNDLQTMQQENIKLLTRLTVIQEQLAQRC